MVHTQPAMATECNSNSVAIATACRIARTVSRLKREAECRGRRTVGAVAEGLPSDCLEKRLPVRFRLRPYRTVVLFFFLHVYMLLDGSMRGTGRAVPT
jgi:hypothetical protein